MISEGVCKPGATILLEELQTRFKRFMDPEIDEFDPTLIIATCLDPRYKCVLRANQIRAASNALISEVSLYSYASFSKIFPKHMFFR